MRDFVSAFRVQREKKKRYFWRFPHQMCVGTGCVCTCFLEKNSHVLKLLRCFENTRGALRARTQLVWVIRAIWGVFLHSYSTSNLPKVFSWSEQFYHGRVCLFLHSQTSLKGVIAVFLHFVVFQFIFVSSKKMERTRKSSRLWRFCVNPFRSSEKEMYGSPNESSIISERY